MNIFVFVTILVVLQLVCLWVGQLSAKNVHNAKGYFLANKEIKFFPLLMTFVATQIGGGLILGSAEEAFQFGWTVLLYPLGACLGFLVLALGIGKKLAEFEVATVAELLGVAYRSPTLKKVASVLSILSLFMILMGQVIASRKFIVSLGMDHSFLFLLFWAVVIIYTVIGGLRAVVSIDIVQAAFFIVVFTCGLAYILVNGNFAVSPIIQSGFSSEVFEFDLPKLTGWLLMPLLFMVIEQDMAQRCFAAKSPRIVAKAAGYAALCTFFVSIIPVFIGILGKAMGITVPSGSSVFMVVVEVFSNPVVAAFVGCAVLMAILSTAISLLNAVSSNLSQDFNFVRSKGERGVRISRQITAGIGFAAVLCSFYPGSIVDLLIESYELSVYCLFIPVFFGLFKIEKSTSSAWGACLFGGIGFIITRFFYFDFPKEILCLLASSVGYWLGELPLCKCTKKIPRESSTEMIGS